MNWTPVKHYPKLIEVDKTLSDIVDNPSKSKAGIYIWGFIDDEKLFWPYYVGKHWNIPYRLCQHLSSLKGGFYTIYAKEDLFTFEDKRIYNAENTERWIHFIQDGKLELQPHVDNMINRFHFTYTLIEDFENNGTDAEKSVLQVIKKEILINTRYGNPKKSISIGNLFEIIDLKWKR